VVKNIRLTDLVTEGLESERVFGGITGRTSCPPGDLCDPTSTLKALLILVSFVVKNIRLMDLS